MSKLTALLDELCPDGVEYVAAGEIAQIGTGSSDRKDAIEDAEFPFFVRSETVMRHSEYEYDETAIVIPGEGGVGEIFHYVSGKYALHQRAYRVSFTTDAIDTRFAFYHFQANFKRFIERVAVTATVKSIRKPMLTKFPIPVPPLEVQQEIVRVLDAFTDLEQNLVSELELRKKQFEVYRGKLFNFGHFVEWSTLGEVSVKVVSGGTPSSQNPSYYGGDIPWLRTQEINFKDIHSTEMYITEEGLNNSSAKWIPANCVIVAMYGATAAKSAVNVIPLTTNQACCNLEINPSFAEYRFVFHWVSHMYENLKSLGEGSQSNINSKKVKSFRIPLPPLETQREIVAKLDSFDSLIQSIEQEISLRRQQYEFYRDELLSFDPKED